MATKYIAVLSVYEHEINMADLRTNCDRVDELE